MTMVEKKVRVVIDGIEYFGKPEQTILELCIKRGIDLPHICYNPVLGKRNTGNCRMCLVEIGEGRSKIIREGCQTPLRENMVVHTTSRRIYDLRRTILHLTMSQHEQSCRDCPTSGDCPYVPLCRDLDLSATVVCAMCPLQGESCNLSRGNICLGPLTYSGCNAYCTRNGSTCIGCRGVFFHPDIIRFAVRDYRKFGINLDHVIDLISLFSYSEEGRKVVEEIKRIRGDDK
ncbi:MAG: 2Fe-2S iron-sulfur cluster-binding protein [Thermoplasmatota archaeon]